MRRLDKAWRVLSNPFERARYDRHLASIDSDSEGWHLDDSPTVSVPDDRREKRKRTEVIRVDQSGDSPASRAAKTLQNRGISCHNLQRERKSGNRR